LLVTQPTEQRTMAPLKSILRSGSFFSNNSKTPSFDFDNDDDGDESEKHTLPPRLRKKGKSSKAKDVKPKHAAKAEARVDEEPRVVKNAREPRDVPQSPSRAHGDDKIDKIIDIDAFSMIHSFISMVTSYGEDEKEYKFSVADDESVVQGDGLEITLQNYLEYEQIRKERLQSVTEDDDSEEATCGESLASEEKLMGENIALESPEESKLGVESTNKAPPPQKEDKRIPFQIAEDNLIQQLWLPRLERNKELKQINKAELQKMKEHVEKLKEAMTQRKLQRMFVAKTVEDRMHKNFKVLEESREAQKKIEAEYERILKKSQTPKRPQTILFPQMSEDDDVDVPPPLQNGFKVEQYPEYEVHFTDVPILPELEGEDNDFNYIHREFQVNSLSAKVLDATQNAWGDLLDLAEDLVTYIFTNGGCSPDSESSCGCSAGIPDDIEYDNGSIAEEPETEVDETKVEASDEEEHDYVIIDAFAAKKKFSC